jgi:cobalt-zinc-cadmium efflux system membrane fusion protein
MRKGLWLIICLLPLAAGCRGEGAQKAPEAPAPAESAGERVTLSSEALAGLGIEAVPVERRGLMDEIRATAVIKPNENRLAHVSPPITGRAIEVRTVLGDLVQPGQTLALLDSLQLGEKKAAFLQARTNLEVARRNAEREERLFKQRISSEKEYFEAKGEFERGDAAYRAAREALRLLGLTDQEIEGITWGGKDHPLSHFPILAPFGGTVIEQHITMGELVTPEDKPYTIADLTTLWILLDIYEKDLGRVSVGKDVQVRVDAYPDEAFSGQIVYLSHVLDESTRTARARVEIDNRAGRLRPGMFATAMVALPVPGSRAVLLIPEAAIQRIHGEPTAFVEESPGTYGARTLTLGAQAGEVIEVKAGLHEGERVVTTGAFTLKSILLKGELAGED